MNCSNCNFEINENEKFCKNCGNQVKKENKTLMIVRDVILYIISFIVLLVTIIMFISNKAVVPLVYAIVSLILLCPITYKLIIKVFRDLDKVHIRIVGIILTLLFSLALIPTDGSKTNSNLSNNSISNFETSKTNNEDKNVTETNKISPEEQARIEQEKAQKEAEENAKKEEEKRKQEEEKRRQEEEKRRQEEEKRRQEEEKAERIRNGETDLNNGKFTLQAGHKGYYDGFAYYIEGVLVNNTNKKYTYVQIEFNVYDSNGVQLGSAIANINNLDAKGTWKFKAIELGSDTENVASYKVIEVTAF